ncbi:MAG TPA: hypothetical protein VF439_02095 [Candidatus Paceibacterota bacterium]
MPKHVYCYDIRPDLGRRRKIPTVEEQNHLQSLVPVIEKMARRELGNRFCYIAPLGIKLALYVKTGTSKNPRTKFKLRALLGWVELFDSEQPT